MPWSAQWMSSNTSTSGLRRAIASITERTAEKNASRMRCGSSLVGLAISSGASMPSSRADHGGAALAAARPARRRRSASASRRGRAACPTPPRCCRRRGSRPRRGSPRRAPSRRFRSRTGGSGPRGRWAPARAGAAAARAPAAGATCRRRPARSRVTRCGRRLALDPVVDGLAAAPACPSRPTSGVSPQARAARAGWRASRPIASHAGTGSALPFSVSGSSSW